MSWPRQIKRITSDWFSCRFFFLFSWVVLRFPQGFDPEDYPPPVWMGGETVAKQQLGRHLERKAWVANFERPRMSSTSLMACPTGLGPYLRFGCLSPRLFYWRLTELYQKVQLFENCFFFAPLPLLILSFELCLLQTSKSC